MFFTLVILSAAYAIRAFASESAISAHYKVTWSVNEVTKHPSQADTYVATMNDQEFEFTTNDCNFTRTLYGMEFTPHSEHCTVIVKDTRTQTVIHGFIRASEDPTYSQTKDSLTQVVMCPKSTMIIAGCHLRCGNGPFEPLNFKHCDDTDTVPPTLGFESVTVKQPHTDDSEPKMETIHIDDVHIRDGAVYQLIEEHRDGHNFIRLHPWHKLTEKIEALWYDTEDVQTDRETIRHTRHELSRVTKVERNVIKEIIDKNVNSYLKGAIVNIAKLKAQQTIFQSKMNEIMAKEDYELQNLWELLSDTEAVNDLESRIERDMLDEFRTLKADTLALKHDAASLSSDVE